MRYFLISLFLFLSACSSTNPNLKQFSWDKTFNGVQAIPANKNFNKAIITDKKVFN